MLAVQQVMQFYGAYIVWPDISQLCSSGAIYCLILQLIARTINLFFTPVAANNHKRLKELYEYYKLEEQNPVHRQILNKDLKDMEAVIDGYLKLLAGLFCIPNVTAWILSWYNNEFIYYAPVFLPFIDRETLSGFIILSAFHAYQAGFAYFALMISDIKFIYFVYQCMPKVEILSLKLNSFERELSKTKIEEVNLSEIQSEPSTSSKIVDHVKLQKRVELIKKMKIAKVEQQFIDLIKEVKEYHDYIASIMEIVTFTTFSAMTTNSTGIGLSIIAIFFHSKAIGAMLATVLTIQVLVPCIEGTFLSHQKEKLLNELYGFAWYELSLPKQKLFLQLLHLVQTSSEFKLPIIGTLNMEIFTSVMNGAYSFCMYLFEFLKWVLKEIFQKL